VYFDAAGEGFLFSVAGGRGAPSGRLYTQQPAIGPMEGVKGRIMEKRVGFVGIIIQKRKESAEKVNGILSEFGESIVVRTGVPRGGKDCSVITLVVNATSDEIGALTGRLGCIKGVSVKSMLGKLES
jgi:putative iron-only hydrogenase system regulator